jgi:hypothetical protein
MEYIIIQTKHPIMLHEDSPSPRLPKMQGASH